MRLQRGRRSRSRSRNGKGRVKGKGLKGGGAEAGAKCETLWLGVYPGLRLRPRLCARGRGRVRGHGGGLWPVPVPVTVCARVCARARACAGRWSRNIRSGCSGPSNSTGLVERAGHSDSPPAPPRLCARPRHSARGRARLRRRVLRCQSVDRRAGARVEFEEPRVGGAGKTRGLAKS